MTEHQLIVRRPHPLLAKILLDLTSMRPFLATLGGLLVMAFIFGVLLDQLSAAVPIIGVGFALLPSQLLTVDEMYGLNRLYGALPLRRSTVINSYFVILLAGLMVAMAMGLALVAVTGKAVDEPLLWFIAPWLGIGLAIFLAVQLSVVIKYGARRGAMVSVGVVAALFGFGLVLSRVPALVQWLEGPMNNLVAAGPGVITAVGALLALGALGISWAICQRVYARQDH